MLLKQVFVVSMQIATFLSSHIDKDGVTGYYVFKYKNKIEKVT